MRSQLLKCIRCERYTFQEVCSVCGEHTTTPLPPRYSPQDKYGKYRRRLKRVK
jgi:H/ACA ribonucleoprotein complex subunit 3